MPSPADRFAAWVRCADSAMLAVSECLGDEWDACLVGFHSQASIDPARYLVWLSTANRTYRLARRAEVLGVHLLADDQLDLARRLGARTGDVDPHKLDGVRHRRGRSGAVHLLDCPAWFAGRVLRRVSGGDHHGFLLEPIAAADVRPVQPLRLRQAETIPAGHPVG